MELYNEQLSYTAADYHIDRYKPYLNFIPRVINSFLFTYSLVIFENIILGDYLGISNDILYLTTASNFIFVAPLIDKILQKRYYEKVKKSTMNEANIADANNSYRLNRICLFSSVLFLKSSSRPLNNISSYTLIFEYSPSGRCKRLARGLLLG